MPASTPVRFHPLSTALRPLCLLLVAFVSLPAMAEDQGAEKDAAFAKDLQEGFVSLWDGKTFDNWKISENPETFTIDEGKIVVHGKRSHLFYVGELAPFKNFELKVDVLAKANSNSGIYFHTQFQESGWPSEGFETQVNNSYNSDPRKTGSLYAVSDVKETSIEDDIWWTQHITVTGNHVVIKLNDQVVTDYTQPEDYVSADKKFSRKFGEGTFALQGHDPKSIVWFKNIRVKKLPD